MAVDDGSLREVSGDHGSSAMIYTWVVVLTVRFTSRLPADFDRHGVVRN